MPRRGTGRRTSRRRSCRRASGRPAWRGRARGRPRCRVRRRGGRDPAEPRASTTTGHSLRSSNGSPSSTETAVARIAARRAGSRRRHVRIRHCSTARRRSRPLGGLRPRLTAVDGPAGVAGTAASAVARRSRIAAWTGRSAMPSRASSIDGTQPSPSSTASVDDRSIGFVADLGQVDEDVAAVGRQGERPAVAGDPGRPAQALEPAHRVAEPEPAILAAADREADRERFPAHASLAVRVPSVEPDGIADRAARLGVPVVVDDERAFTAGSDIRVGEDVLVDRAAVVDDVVQPEAVCAGEAGAAVEEREDRPFVVRQQALVDRLVDLGPAELHAVLLGEPLDLAVAEHRQPGQGAPSASRPRSTCRRSRTGRRPSARPGCS